MLRGARGHLRSSFCGAPFLARGRSCNLLKQFAVTLLSCPTHDHILLSHLRLLGSFTVASYDSRGYGGGILTRLQSAATDLNTVLAKAHTKTTYYLTSWSNQATTGDCEDACQVICLPDS
jgi:hypothetical protein